MTSRISACLFNAAAALLVTGCGDETFTDPPKDAPPTLPTLDAGWNEFEPGGDTICSRGTPYAYYVRPGTVNRVIIDFIGGGACWNQLTCSVANQIFEPTVDSVREAVQANDPRGFYDHDNPENPFKDWYHVVIPYCTGDIHWGDAITTYGKGTDAVVINHKGAVNTRAVLDWVYESFSAPEDIFVTGCSAGSYGSALWAPWIMQHYPNARVSQFGDSGAGIITKSFFEDSFPSWNAEQAFPSFIPALDPAKVDLLSTELPDLYAGVGNFFPTQRVSQYNTTFDENQTFYYIAMGGEGGAEAWSKKMLGSVKEIEQRAANFGSFGAAGEQHCILPYDNFYSVNVDGYRLVDWLKDMVAREPVERVACTDCSGKTP